jgi:hypothetical protein
MVFAAFLVNVSRFPVSITGRSALRFLILNTRLVVRFGCSVVIGRHGESRRPNAIKVFRDREWMLPNIPAPGKFRQESTAGFWQIFEAIVSRPYKTYSQRY